MNAQVISDRLISVKIENREKFHELASKKTKMFNNGRDAKVRFRTFKILTGPNAGKYRRFRLASNLEELDIQDSKAEGAKYWRTNVTPLINKNSGTYIWRVSKSSSYRSGNESVNLRNINFVRVKNDKREDFWRWRNRIKIAAEKAKIRYDIGVWYLYSGGNDSGIVMIRKHFKDFADEQKGNGGELKKAYESIYGDGSWEKELERYRESIDWQHRRHHRLMPKLSSF